VYIVRISFKSTDGKEWIARAGNGIGYLHSFSKWLSRTAIRAPSRKAYCITVKFGPTSTTYNVISLIISASLRRAKRSCYRTFACAICLSAHVSSGDTRKWIGMPFGVVSGVGLGSGVLDFGGDRRRGRGSLGGEYNAEMAY